MPEAGWVDRSIADCLDTSFAGEWGTETTPSNAIVLRATDIDDAGHVVGAGAARSIPKSKLRSKQLRDGDILLEGSGGGPNKPVGRVALFEADGHVGPALCSNFFKTLRPKRAVVSERFLWRKLGWFYGQPALLALQQQTTGIINLKFAEYLEARLDVPSKLAEQVEIAKILDTLDTTIRQTEVVIEKLKQIRHGLLHDLLTRGIDANGELRPPQSQAPHLYKESPLGWIPTGWQFKRFREIGRAPQLGLTVRGASSDHANVGLLKMGNLSADNQLDLDQVEPIDPERIDRVDDFLLDDGDLLFNTRNTPELVGKTCSWRGQFGSTVFDNNILRMRVAPSAGNGHFIASYMGGSAGRARLLGLATGTTSVAAIYWKDLQGFVLPLPMPDEQGEIVKRLDACDSRATRERTAANALMALKSGLMDDLLTGRVRVTPLLDPAAQE